ncbi:ABC transporter ATP-binding protein [Cellulosispirillum alkaliphilum]|uniref:ABC transporter ATP-binding protein n=1 Tax=Cellulosispirillum alkaliphilum TaxID=3039283 RepID=UPI003D6F7406
MEVITTNNLKKEYHESEVPVKALNGVNLTILDGEFTAIVGPSGSGKSTLLHLLGGLDRPTQGTVVIDKTDIGKLSSGEIIDFRLFNIGFVFQAYNLIPVLTAKENIEFIMMLQKVDKHQRRNRSLELLEAVGLKKRADHRPVQLSGGEQQRVAVARALASKPKFVLADEPTANLDSRSAENLLDLMAELNSKLKTTILFSTHDERVIKRARRVVSLLDGEVRDDSER